MLPETDPRGECGSQLAKNAIVPSGSIRHALEFALGSESRLMVLRISIAAFRDVCHAGVHLLVCMSAKRVRLVDVALVSRILVCQVHMGSYGLDGKTLCILKAFSVARTKLSVR